MKKINTFIEAPLRTMNNVNIEVIGSFVWVYGETDAHADLLKAHRFIKRTGGSHSDMPNAWYRAPKNWKPKKELGPHAREQMVRCYRSRYTVNL